MNNINACCRLCLIVCPDSFNVLNDAIVRERISKIFRFNILETDKLPKMICNECYGIITNFFEYSEKVLNNQLYLKQLYEAEEAEKLKQELEKVIKNEPAFYEEINCETVLDIKQDIEETFSPLNGSENEDNNDDDNDDASFEPEESPKLIKINIRQRAKDKSPAKKIVRTVKKTVIKKETLSPTGTDSKLKSKDERDKEDDLIREYFKLVCDVCAKPTESFIELRKHFREAHKKTGYVKCCNKKMYRKCRMMEHLAKHMNPEAFRCHICNKNYSCRTSLELHNIHTHLTESEKPYKCDKCSKSFAKKYHLTCHMVRHVAVKCPVCDKTLASRLCLKDHLIKVHTDQTTMICDVCAKVFKSKQSFDRHRQEHFGTAPNNKVQCRICDRWLTDKQGLKKHVRTQHMEVNELFYCNICGKQSPNSTALASHKKTVHVEEKFECGICNKRFKRAISLKEHTAGHTGEVLYHCPYCAKTFNSNANMHSHKKKAHPMEWEENRNKFKM